MRGAIILATTLSTPPSMPIKLKTDLEITI